MPDIKGNQDLSAQNFGNLLSAVDEIEMPKDTGSLEIAKSAEPQVVELIESLCMQCQETVGYIIPIISGAYDVKGTTRLLLTCIPYFKEVILISFECPYCGFNNTEIQSAGEIQPTGFEYVFKVELLRDLSRQVVKSEYSTCSIPELELEIPPKKGVLTTVEGLLLSVLEDLEVGQPERKLANPDVYEKIETLLKKGHAMINGELFPFTITVRDHSGNSWIEPNTSDRKSKWYRHSFNRSPHENTILGLVDTTDSTDYKNEIDNIPDEVHQFVDACPGCSRPCPTNMKLVDIPHFKEVILMSTVCDACGYKSNEVKTGGAVSPKGRRIKLNVTSSDDLTRDILKSETCSVTIPEISLDLHPGTLGGRFTTLEGLLVQVYDELYGRIFVNRGDSMEPKKADRWEKFLLKLKKAQEGKIQYTIILDDPLASSYIQNIYAPDSDPEMTIEDYERTLDQIEDLGLNDMVV